MPLYLQWCQCACVAVAALVISTHTFSRLTKMEMMQSRRMLSPVCREHSSFYRINRFTDKFTWLGLKSKAHRQEMTSLARATTTELSSFKAHANEALPCQRASPIDRTGTGVWSLFEELAGVSANTQPLASREQRGVMREDHGDVVSSNELTLVIWK